MSDGASWGDSKEYKEAQARAGTNPFDDISDPKQLRAMVKDGVECEECRGSGTFIDYSILIWGRPVPSPSDCPTCKGTGHTPLPNADLEALAACWCEGIFVRNWIWKEPKNYTHYVPNPPQYAVRGNWVAPPAYTTSPDAAMPLMLKYALDVDWLNENKGEVLAPLPAGCASKFTKSCESLCHAITTAALIAALTEAIEESRK